MYTNVHSSGVQVEYLIRAFMGEKAEELPQTELLIEEV